MNPRPLEQGSWWPAHGYCEMPSTCWPGCSGSQANCEIRAFEPTGTAPAPVSLKACSEVSMQKLSRPWSSARMLASLGQACRRSWCSRRSAQQSGRCCCTNRGGGLGLQHTNTAPLVEGPTIGLAQFSRTADQVSSRTGSTVTPEPGDPRRQIAADEGYPPIPTSDEQSRIDGVGSPALSGKLPIDQPDWSS